MFDWECVDISSIREVKHVTRARALGSLQALSIVYEDVVEDDVDIRVGRVRHEPTPIDDYETKEMKAAVKKPFSLFGRTVGGW
jgi:hypothetical protein